MKGRALNLQYPNESNIDIQVLISDFCFRGVLTSRLCNFWISGIMFFWASGVMRFGTLEPTPAGVNKGHCHDCIRSVQHFSCLLWLSRRHPLVASLVVVLRRHSLSSVPFSSFVAIETPSLGRVSCCCLAAPFAQFGIFLVFCGYRDATLGRVSCCCLAAPFAQFGTCRR